MIFRKTLVGKRSGRTLFQVLNQLKKGGVSLFDGYLGKVSGFSASFFSHYLLKQTSRLRPKRQRAPPRRRTIKGACKLFKHEWTNA